MKNPKFPCLLIHQLLASPRKQINFIEVMNYLNFMIEIDERKNTFNITARTQAKEAQGKEETPS